MIESFRIIAFKKRKNVGIVTRCCVCCYSSLDVHFQKFFALDVSPKTTAELLLLFIPSCTYNFNDLSCENTKSVRVLSSSSAPCPTADPWRTELVREKSQELGLGSGAEGGDPDAFFSKGAK